MTTDAAAASLRAAIESSDDDVTQQQPPPPPQPPTSSSSPPTDTLAQVMQLLTTLITQMPANIAAAVKVDKPSTHLDNAKLDHRSFTRIQNFTNKHSDWREWKNHFIYAVAECDNSFATTLTGMEKGDKPILMVDLNPTQSQLSAVLFNRLQAVTTNTANTMVLGAEGNGCETCRLLNTFYDPQTDQRLTKSIMDVINFKIKGKEIQSGIMGAAGKLPNEGPRDQAGRQTPEGFSHEHPTRMDVWETPGAFGPASDVCGSPGKGHFP